MSATPASLSAHWKKFLFAGLAALAVVWYFAFQGAAHGDHRGPLSVVLGALFWVATLIGLLMLTMITRVFDANNREIDLFDLRNFRLNTASSGTYRNYTDDTAGLDLNVKRSLSLFKVPVTLQTGGLLGIQVTASGLPRRWLLPDTDIAVSLVAGASEIFVPYL